MGIDRILDGAFKKPFEADLTAKASLRGPREAAAEDKTEKPAAGLDKVEAIASEVQIFLKRLNTELRFEVDSRSKEVIVKIIDPSNGEVIRQIPTEELLTIRKRMEDLAGVLYKSST